MRHDWNLRTCARRGHITFAPDEPEVAAAVRADTGHGQAWRCLRCGTFVLGDPTGSGPVATAPAVPRGAALRAGWLLRVLAIERFARALALLAGAYGLWRYRDVQRGLVETIARTVPLLRPAATSIGVDLDHSELLNRARTLLATDPHTLSLLALGLLTYAGLQAAEGIGLWSGQRWGEYLAVVATTLFVPVEIHEVLASATVLRVGALAVNLAMIVYLVLSKRLFGVRGGHRAAHAALASENLLTVLPAAQANPDPEPEANAA